MSSKYDHIVNVSGGAASAVSLIRVIERFGTDTVAPVFADTLAESADLYRFLDELEQHVGIKIHRLCQGKSTWELFEYRAMWTNPHAGGCIASARLKREPLIRFANDHGSTNSTTIYLGFGIDERDRIARLRKFSPEWTFDFPITWRPALGRCDLMDELRSRGITPSNAYEDGWHHDNCNNQCILAGIKHFIRLLQLEPEKFAQVEQHEIRMRTALAKANRRDHTILRDRRGGGSTNLPLSELRRQIESGERIPGPTDGADSCSCVGTIWEDSYET